MKNNTSTTNKKQSFSDFISSSRNIQKTAKNDAGSKNLFTLLGGKEEEEKEEEKTSFSDFIAGEKNKQSTQRTTGQNSSGSFLDMAADQLASQWNNMRRESVTKDIANNLGVTDYALRTDPLIPEEALKPVTSRTKSSFGPALTMPDAQSTKENIVQNTVNSGMFASPLDKRNTGRNIYGVNENVDPINSNDDSIYRKNGIIVPEYRQYLNDVAVQNAAKEGSTDYKNIGSGQEYSKNTGKPVSNYKSKMLVDENTDRKEYSYGLFGSGGIDFSKVSEDIDYDLINGNNFARGLVNAEGQTKTYSDEYADKGYLLYLTDEEKWVYNYVYDHDGKEDADKYVNSIRSELLRRQSAYETGSYEEMAHENPAFSSAVAALMSPTKIISTAGSITDALLNGSADQNEPYLSYTKTSNTLKSTVASDIEEKYGAGAQFVYNAAMSALENTVNASFWGGTIGATAKLGEELSLITMASGAAVDSYIEAKDRGLDNTHAAVTAGVAGIVEYLTEKIGWGSHFEPDVLKDGILKAVAKSAVTESFEEFIGNIANTLFDNAYNGDDSKFNAAVQQYMNEGLSEEDAYNKAELDWYKEVALDTASGLVSGLMMSGANQVTTAISDVANGSSIRKSENALQNIKDEVILGKLAQEGTQTRSLADKLGENIDNEKYPSNYQIGKMERLNSSYLEDAATSETLIEKAAREYANAQSVKEDENSGKLKRAIAERRASKAEKALVKSDNITVDNTLAYYNNNGETENAEKLGRREAIDTLKSKIAERRAEIKTVNEAVDSFAKELGQNGQDAIQILKDGNTENITDRVQEFTQIYNIGKTTGEMNQVYDLINNLSAEEAQEAFTAGQIDAADEFERTNLYETESVNAETVNAAAETEESEWISEEAESESGPAQSGVSDEERVYSVGNSGTNAAAAEVRGKTTDAQRASIKKQQTAVRDYVKANAVKPVSAAAENITGGSDTASMYIIGTDGYTDEMNSIRAFYNSKGYNVKFFSGSIKMENGSTMRGAIQHGARQIWIQADNGKLTVTQIAKHEWYHALQRQSINAVRENSRLDTLNDVLTDKLRGMGENRLAELVKRYTDMYAWTDKDAYEIMEEILADAYAGIDIDDYMSTYQAATRYTEAVQEGIREDEKRMEESRGPPIDTYDTLEGPDLEEDVIDPTDRETLKEMADAKEHMDPGQESKFSTEYDSELLQVTKEWMEEHGVEFNDNYKSAGAIRARMKAMMQDSTLGIKYLLPEEILSDGYMKTIKEGKRTTVFGNSSYSKSVENSTICIRSLQLESLFDEAAKKLGHSLTTSEAISISQMAWNFLREPTCQYCYVFADRVAERNARNQYMRFKDQVLKEVGSLKGKKIVTENDLNINKVNKKGDESTQFDVNRAIKANPQFEKQYRAYDNFLSGKKNTANMQQRFIHWLDAAKNGKASVTDAMVATDVAMYEAVQSNPDLAWEMNDVYLYAHSASHAKKKYGYTAYNSDILGIPEEDIKFMNEEYGIRFYSYSDYHPAYVLENMQMFTDAAARGLKGLAYTKDIDYAKIFAPTGCNINISIKSINSIGPDGKFHMDGMQGADWEQAKALRQQYKNVGTVLVAMNDEQVEWALDQDWIDVIIPYHVVFNTSIGDYFNWTNYKAMQSDKHLKGWKAENGDKTSITPPYHQNDKETYLRLCKENHLEPRFKKWVDHPNYMKLVNETRQSESETRKLQPIFDEEAAKESLLTLKMKGKHDAPFGGSEDNLDVLSSEFVDRYKNGQRYDPVTGRYGAEIGVNIRNDGELHYASMIASGEKVWETRDSNTLDPYIGKRVALVETGGSNGAIVVGYATIGEPVELTAKQFQQAKNRKLHKVPKGSQYDVKPGGKKFCYPMENVVSFDTFEAPEFDRSKGDNYQVRKMGDNYMQFSEDLDEEYMGLAKDPEKNKDRLQELVYLQAEAQFKNSKLRTEDGNLRLMYHGTNDTDFREFNSDFIGSASGDDGFFGMGFYFAFTHGEASYYGSRRVINAFLNMENPFDFEKELNTYEGKRAQGGYAPDAVFFMNFADKFPDIAKNIEVEVFIKKTGEIKYISLGEFSKQFKDVIENKKFKYSEIKNQFGETETIVTADEKTIEYEYDGKTHSYIDFDFQQRFYGTPNDLDVAFEYLSKTVYGDIFMYSGTSLILDNNREFTKELRRRGYDGAVQSMRGDEAVVFESSQIKDASPVTYDKDGNVIPLSKRFNLEDNDIYFSQDIKLNPREITKTDTIDLLTNVKNGKYDNRTYIPVKANTPKYIIEEANNKGYELKNLPMIMSVKKALGAMSYDDSVTVHPHYLTPEELTDIIYNVDDAIGAVIEKAKNDNQKDRILLYVKSNLSDKNIFTGYYDEDREDDIKKIRRDRSEVVIEITEESKSSNILNGYEGGYYNVIVTAYGEYVGNYDRIENDKNNIVLIKRGTSQSGSTRQRASHLNDVPENNITDFGYSVNNETYFSEESKYEQLEREYYDLRRDYIKTRQLMNEYAKRNDQLYRQFTETYTPQVKESYAIRNAKKLIYDYNSDAEVDEIAYFIKEAAETILGDPDGSKYEAAKGHAIIAAEKIIEGSKMLTNDTEVKMAKELREYLRNGEGVRLSDYEKREIVNYKDFRDTTRNYVKWRSTGKPWTEVYDELGNKFGLNYFPPDLAISDQFQQLKDFIESTNPVFASSYDTHNMAEAVESVAMEILNLADENIVELMPQTLADKIRIRERRNAEKAHERVEKLLNKELERRKKMIQRTNEYYEELADRQRNKKIENDARNKLLRVASRVSKMKTDQATKAYINSLIGDLDVVSRHLTDTSIRNLSRLKELYERYKQSGWFNADDRIERNIARLEHKFIDDMTLQDVRDLTEILQNIEKQKTDGRIFIDSQINDTTFTAAGKTMEHIKYSKHYAMKFNEKTGEYDVGVKKVIDDLFVGDALSPERVVHRIVGFRDDDAMYILTKEISDGQRKMLKYMQDNYKLFEKWTNDKKYMRKIRGNQAELLTVNLQRAEDDMTDAGIKRESVQMTRAMLMSLIMHSENPQNMMHVKHGGVVIPNMNLYKKGNLEEAYAAGHKYRMDRYDIYKLRSLLTKEDLAFMAAAKSYFSGVSQKQINEVSEKLKGYSLALVENYFPINTDSTFLSTDFEELKDGTIQGMGFLKERINGTNAILLRDMNSVLTQSIDMTAKYVGLAIPVENFNKLWKAGAGEVVDVYMEKPNEETRPLLNKYNSRTNIANEIQKKWGKRGVKYIQNFMKDVQSQRPSSDEAILQKFRAIRSAYAGAVLTLGLSVAIKQTASYFTAGAILDPKSLAKAINPFVRVRPETINKWTPLYWQRARGYGSPELGDFTNMPQSRFRVLDWIRGRDLPKALNWIQAMDLLTTRRLWLAAEYNVRKTRKDLKVGSDEYYQTVAKLYNQVIEETQPNYTTMQRPGFLRSNSDVIKSLLMFKTQPLQNFNIVYDSFGNMKAKRDDYICARKVKGSKNDEKEKAKVAYVDSVKRFNAAVISQFFSAVVLSQAVFFWKFASGKDDDYRDEDTGKLDLARWASVLGLDMLSNAASMVPFMNLFYEAGHAAISGERYYGVDEVTTSALSDFLSALVKQYSNTKSLITNAAKDDDDETKNKIDAEDILLNLDSLASVTSKLIGVPYDSVKNIAVGAIYDVEKIKNGYFWGKYTKTKILKDNEDDRNALVDILYKAYKNDRDQYDLIYSDMLESGMDEEKIVNRLNYLAKQEYGVSKLDELDDRHFLQSDQEKIDSITNEISTSSVYKDAAGMLDELTIKNLIRDTVTDKTTKEKIEKGAEYGLDESDYVLYRLALELNNDADENLEKHNKQDHMAAAAMLGLDYEEIPWNRLTSVLK